MRNEPVQVISLYLDDSGVFTIGEKSKFFVYGGYSFTNDKDRLTAKNVYKKRVLQIKAGLGLGADDELKAAMLNAKHKRSLFEILKNYNSLDCAVNIDNVYPSILENKLSVHRYKDYVLKRLIKIEIERLISAGSVDPFRAAALRVYIDQQHTSTDGYYTLSESISEELNHGIHNFEYGVFHAPLFKAPVSVKIEFCDSKHHYLIQASDILANRAFTAYNFNLSKLMQDIPHHNHLDMP
ncbi:DUF3800 domain-containing protein [Candidatus Saccharibacteria bacterium]|nr:DUF3800 domain-containing protein [Candidatus Saccharibacteria bacterium]